MTDRNLFWGTVSSYTGVVAGKKLHTLIPTNVNACKFLQKKKVRVLVPTRREKMIYYVPTTAEYILENTYSYWIHTTNACESFHSDNDSNFYHQTPVYFFYY